jgi:CRISP-associated protein Cas1
VKKTSGKGRRPIVLMDVQDRVVQKSASLILQPILEPLFDPLSFAYRPRRSREQAIAVAQKLTQEGYHYWLTHDLKDAFCRVPVSRLLDVFFKHLPCKKLRQFLERVLPPQAQKLTGIKQGGPLSTLALELYLNHFLDRPWRNAGHGVRIIRYADDLLLLAPDENAARETHLALRKLLTPAGMLLKHSFEEAVHDIRTIDADWLGFKFRNPSAR